MTGLTSLLRRAVQLQPGNTATIFADRRQTWSDFAARVARLAGALTGLAAPNDRIGILALNSDRYLEFFNAVAWAGQVFVPINTRLAPPEIVFWLTDPGCTLLFIDDAFLPTLPLIRAAVPTLRAIVYLGDAPCPDGLLAYETLIAAATPAPDANRAGADLAGIFYTGGTTGRSKGVMLSHGNFIANMLNLAAEVDYSETTRLLHAAPMFHIADNAAAFLVTAKGGAHVILPRFDPLAVLQTISTHHTTDGLLVPTMINMLVHHPAISEYDLSSVRGLLYGASPMPEAVIRRALEVMPNVGFTQLYGQTESSPCMTALSPHYHCFTGPFAGRIKSAGRALIGCEIAILDPEDCEVPRGTVGEICGRGACVMQGYWNQPELTAQTLRNGWLHTGDGGYMDNEGFVYVVDRVKDMIITGGENVYSAEVEEALYSHQAVAECAVIGIPDEQWGERVHAVVRLKPDQTATETDLIEACRARIAGFKLPRSITLRDDPLPLSGAGKILKTELRKPYWEGHDRRVS